MSNNSSTFSKILIKSIRDPHRTKRKRQSRQLYKGAIKDPDDILVFMKRVWVWVATITITWNHLQFWIQLPLLLILEAQKVRQKNKERFEKIYRFWKLRKVTRERSACSLLLKNAKTAYSNVTERIVTICSELGILDLIPIPKANGAHTELSDFFGL